MVVIERFPEKQKKNKLHCMREKEEQRAVIYSFSNQVLFYCYVFCFIRSNVLQVFYLIRSYVLQLSCPLGLMSFSSLVFQVFCHYTFFCLSVFFCIIGLFCIISLLFLDLAYFRMLRFNARRVNAYLIQQKKNFFGVSPDIFGKEIDKPAESS